MPSVELRTGAICIFRFTVWASVFIKQKTLPPFGSRAGEIGLFSLALLAGPPKQRDVRVINYDDAKLRK